MSGERAAAARRRTGKVLAVLENGLYSVRADDGGVVTAHVSQEMRLYNVRLLTGDKVVLELSPYDPSRGRIVDRA